MTASMRLRYLAIKKAESIPDDRLFCCAYLYDIEHSLVTVRILVI